jgi:hypothetical protein
VDLEGVILGEDEVVGVADNRLESVTLGNNNELLDAAEQGGAGQNPDAKRSWFHEVRVDAETTCEEVLLLEDQGRLARIRPF